MFSDWLHPISMFSSSLEPRQLVLMDVSMISEIWVHHLILCVYCSNFQNVAFDNSVERSKIENT